MIANVSSVFISLSRKGKKKSELPLPLSVPLVGKTNFVVVTADLIKAHVLATRCLRSFVLAKSGPAALREILHSGRTSKRQKLIDKNVSQLIFLIFCWF